MLKFLKKKKEKDQSEAELLDANESSVEDRPLIFPSLVDNALNDGVTFLNDHLQLQTSLGRLKYGRSFFIKPSGYPRTVRIGWLEGLLTSDDMDCSVHVEPFNRSVAVRKLKTEIDRLEAVLDSAAKNANQSRVDETMQKIHDTRFLQNQIRNNQNGLYYVSVQATIYANSYEELNAKCVEVERDVSAESIELISAHGRQKEGWLSTLPLGRNFLAKSDRNLDQQALTAIFPHSSSRLNHTGGIPIGVSGNEYVYFNQFDTKLNNFNLGVFGESGSGKSTFLKQILGRGFSDGIYRTVVLDVEPEYTSMAHALGGTVIEIRSDDLEQISRINPLDLYTEKEIINKGSQNEFIQERVNLTEKIKEVIEFFKVMKETAAGYDSSLTPIELGVLNDILEDLYRNRTQVTDDPESLYEQVQKIDDDGSIHWERKYVKMPTISDVYEELQKKSKEGYDQLQDLINVVKLFTKGKAFGLFDGQTRLAGNAAVNLDTSPMIVFDISKLSESGVERPLAQHVLMTWIWNRFVKNDPKSKKRIVQDEAWMTLRYKTWINFFKLLSARGRKWNVSLTLVSQRYEMFHRTKEAQDIIAQLGTVAFLKQSDQDIECILDTFRFSDEVGQLIRTADQGEVILKAGKEVVQLLSEPTPGEWPYLNTNQNLTAEDIING